MYLDCNVLLSTLILTGVPYHLKSVCELNGVHQVDIKDLIVYVYYGISVCVMWGFCVFLQKQVLVIRIYPKCLEYSRMQYAYLYNRDTERVGCILALYWSLDTRHPRILPYMYLVILYMTKNDIARQNCNC